MKGSAQSREVFKKKKKKKQVQKINLVNTNTKDPPINNSVPSNLIRDLAGIPLANLNKGLLKDIMI